jgi:hypothetical protein
MRARSRRCRSGCPDPRSRRRRRRSARRGGGTVTSSRKMSQSGAAVADAPPRAGSARARPPPERTTSAGPRRRPSRQVAPRRPAPRRCSLRDVRQLLRLDLAGCRGAYRRGRVLEPALRAVDVAQSSSFGGATLRGDTSVSRCHPPADRALLHRRLAQARHELRAEDVDARQDATAADLVLLLDEVTDQVISSGRRALQDRERIHLAPVPSSSTD